MAGAKLKRLLCEQISALFFLILWVFYFSKWCLGLLFYKCKNIKDRQVNKTDPIALPLIIAGGRGGGLYIVISPVNH